MAVVGPPHGGGVFDQQSHGIELRAIPVLHYPALPEGAAVPRPPHPYQQCAIAADGALPLSSRGEVGIMAGVLHDEAPCPSVAFIAEVDAAWHSRAELST